MIGPTKTSLEASINTGGTTRVDEMALTTDGTLRPAANNAEDPPFGTFVSAISRARVPSGMRISVERRCGDKRTSATYRPETRVMVISRGTESLFCLTLCWSGMDSKFQYAEAVKLLAACLGDSCPFWRSCHRGRPQQDRFSGRRSNAGTDFHHRVSDRRCGPMVSVRRLPGSCRRPPPAVFGSMRTICGDPVRRYCRAEDPSAAVDRV
jgi:hypothetical protein